MYRMDILEKLEKGHISVDKAVSMLKKSTQADPSQRTYPDNKGAG